MSANASFQVHPITQNTAARITGVDLNRLSVHDAEMLHQALQQYGVIFLNAQDVGESAFVSFAKHFGTLAPPTPGITPEVEGYPDIGIVRKPPGATRNIGGRWHTDQSYVPDPSYATALKCLKCPPFGGDTLFANMAAAYDTLSPGLQKTLEGLRAVHSSASIHANMKTGLAPEPEVIHPVVIRHPFSGRKILYVNPVYTIRFEGWTQAESQPLLNVLFEHAQRPDFACRHHWQVNDIAVWDNYAMWHFAVNDYAGEDRLMHRIVINNQPFSGV